MYIKIFLPVYLVWNPKRDFIKQSVLNMHYTWRSTLIEVYADKQQITKVIKKNINISISLNISKYQVKIVVFPCKALLSIIDYAYSFLKY